MSELFARFAACLAWPGRAMSEEPSVSSFLCFRQRLAPHPSRTHRGSDQHLFPTEMSTIIHVQVPILVRSALGMTV
ncbi:hypothetical protein IF2G_07611 [Cordyceps javanica]|nr:hypothetical protein IF2G_07611 [Cordyceps javanica]